MRSFTYLGTMSLPRTTETTKSSDETATDLLEDGTSKQVPLGRLTHCCAGNIIPNITAEIWL